MAFEAAPPSETDIAVVGAGPAGIAAARVAAEAGARTVLLDEQAGPGGQIYRGVADVPPARLKILGKDYSKGVALVKSLPARRLTHVHGATVWEVTRDRVISYSVNGTARQLQARRIIVATGATERPMPFPGWTLRGVITAGAGQILLKTAGLLPATPMVLAGSGPLLYLVAVQYLAAGQPIAAIVETTPRDNWRAARRHLFGALRGHAYLRKGLGMLWRLRRAGIRHLRNATELHAIGTDRIESLTVTADGREQTLDCAALLIHTGVVPNVQIGRSLGLTHDWDALQQCWHPRLDPMGRTEADGILIAGDGAGIAGADSAVPSGQIAAYAALDDLSQPGSRSAAIDAARAAQRHQGHARPFLDALYAPAPAFLAPPDETVACRCEEVTAGQIREFVDLGCLGPNQAKSYGRCGMGPCQGRYCGLTVSGIIAAKRGVPMDEVGYFRIRPPLKPVTIGELAAMDDAPASDGAPQPDRDGPDRDEAGHDPQPGG